MLGNNYLDKHINMNNVNNMNVMNNVNNLNNIIKPASPTYCLPQYRQCLIPKACDVVVPKCLPKCLPKCVPKYPTSISTPVSSPTHSPTHSPHSSPSPTHSPHSSPSPTHSPHSSPSPTHSPHSSPTHSPHSSPSPPHLYHKSYAKVPILKAEKVMSPKTKNLIDKYGYAWWHLIRAGYHEDELENLPIHKSQSVAFDLVKNLNLDAFNYGTRCGVILYTRVKGYLLFGFGQDAEYQQLTNFAGGYNKKDKNVITAALREFCEETLGLFCNVNENTVQNDFVVYDKYNVVIFLYTDNDIDDINTAFYEAKKKQTGKIEIEDIVWMTEEALKLTIQQKGYTRCLYQRLRKFLDKAHDFYSQL